MPTNTNGNGNGTRQQVRLCLCGCQREVRNEFAQGHDARLRSQWLREWKQGGMNVDPADEVPGDVELPTSAVEHYCEFNPCRKGCKGYRKLRQRDWLPWQHRSWGRNGNRLLAQARRRLAEMPLNEEGQPYDPASFAAADAANAVEDLFFNPAPEEGEPHFTVADSETRELEERAIYLAQVENEGQAR